MAAADSITGAAVVLPLPAGTAVASALPGGVPATELHLTLAYLPAFPREDAAQFEALRAAVAGWAVGLAPIAATLSGVGRFSGPAEEGDAVVLLADAPALAAPREALVAALTAAGFAVSQAHGFNPHVTLSYVAADAPTPLSRVGQTAVTFEAVEVWRGSTHDAVASLAPPPTPAPPMHRNLRLIPQSYGAPVAIALASLAPTDAAGGPWTEIAYEVELKGYKTKAGHARITAADIDAMVRNFARYPKVPLVVEHADTREGQPVEWAEPRGWIVGVRRGARERTVAGKKVVVATLQAQLSVSDEVRLQILGDVEAGVPPTWPFCSITPATGRDDETGEELGAVLWSVSLTAHPRLADLPRLAASRRPMPKKRRSTDPADPTAEPLELSRYYGDIRTREDLVLMLRTELNLPVSATEAEVLAALGSAITLAGGDAPDGAAGEAIEHIRECMRLPVVDAGGTAPDLAAEVRKALTALPATATPAAEMSCTPTTVTSAAPAAPTKKDPPMKTMLELAAELKIPAATEDAAREAVLTLSRDGAAVRRMLSLPAESPIAAALAPLLTDAAELPKVRAELSKAQGDLKARVEAEERAAAERAELELSRRVDEVCAARGFADDLKEPLLAFGRADRKAFDAKYPAPSATELGQRAQDGARLERIEFGAGRLPPPPAVNSVPTTGATGPVELAAQFQRIAAAAGEALDDLDAMLLTGRSTPAEYARSLGVQFTG